MPLRVLDLFAGCGGLSLGFQQAGHEIVAACEIDQWAADTYRENHGGLEFIQEDIQCLPKNFWKNKYRNKIDLVAGGPPCQGFSVSGKRQYGLISDTNSLVTDFLRVVEEVDPSYVLVENVKGFKTGSLSNNRKVFDFLVDSLKALGYYVYHDTLNAEEYGVPSLRARVFIAGSKNELCASPFPHSNFAKKAKVTAWDAISDLPPLSAKEGTEEKQTYQSRPQNDFQANMRQGSKGVYNHVAMKHTQRLVDRFETIEQGQCSYRIGRKTTGEKVTTYKSNNQRLYAGKPSLCITANFQSTFIHPYQHRNLTAREAARLMTFPDTFILRGKRTQMSSKFLKKYGREDEDFLSQYNQIGNAVPPLLGKKIGEALQEAIEATGSPVRHDKYQLSLAI